MGHRTKAAVRRLRLTTVIAACCVAWFATSSSALPIVFSGYDAASTSLATAPLATTAAADFDAATGPLPVIDFESGGLPAGVTLSPLSVSAGLPDPLWGFNTTPGGSLFHYGTFQTFTFATPIDAFGAFITGPQFSTKTITYTDGTTVVLDLPDFELTGGVLFFGFVDPGASISSVSVNSPADLIGIDDVRYGLVPEPSTLTLLATGVTVLVAHRRSRRCGRSSTHHPR